MQFSPEMRPLTDKIHRQKHLVYKIVYKLIYTAYIELVVLYACFG